MGEQRVELEASIGVRVTVDRALLAEWREGGLLDAGGRLNNDDGFAWDVLSDALACPPADRQDLRDMSVQWIDVHVEETEDEEAGVAK